MHVVHEHLAEHHGVVTRSEATSLGLTKSQVDSHLRSGRWHRIGPSVFRVAGAPATWLGSARALALSSGGLISHRAAARVHGFDGFERARLEVTVGPKIARARDDTSRWHRSSQLDRAEPREVRGVPVTGIGRTVLDLAGVIDERRLNEVVDEVLRRRLIDWPRLYGVLVAHARRGRNGCGPLRALLDRRFGDVAIPDSRWNRMVGTLLVEAGLARPEFEFEVYDASGEFLGRADLAWPIERLIVELDSIRYHHNLDSFVRDRRRTNRLTAAGWTVLSFTWQDYVDQPHELVAMVRAQLL